MPARRLLSRADVHATAIVDPRAKLAPGVVVGAYSVVGPDVCIGAGTTLDAHVVVRGNTTIGEANTFLAFSVIGGEPQIRKTHGEAPTAPRALVIGDQNVFREHVTVNVASGPEAPTTIGSNNLFMAGSHLAHDVVVGSHCVVANAVQLAGHVVVEDWVTFGGLAGVAQRLRVGQSAFVAAGAMCERDVPPFAVVQGNRARVRALNVVGLERRGISAASIACLKRAFVRTLLRTGSNEPFDVAVRALNRSDPFVDALASALLRQTPGASA